MLTVAPLVCTGTLAGSTGSKIGEVTLPALPGAMPLPGADDRLAARSLGVEPGRDHGDAHLVAERVVDDGAEDDVGFRMRGVLHQRGRLVDLEQPEIAAAGHRHEHALGALHRRLEQRRVDRDLGGLERPAVAACRTDAHQRRARARHDALDVGEVDVDQAGRGDQVGDALHAVEQHLVGAAERVHQRDGGVAHLQQAVVGDHD